MEPPLETKHCSLILGFQKFALVVVLTDSMTFFFAFELGIGLAYLIVV